jgi:hypothetical protein
MMRALIATVICAVAGSAAATDSDSFQLRNAADLVRVCSVAKDDPGYAEAIGFCHGLLIGAYRYYQSAVPVDGRFICEPDPMPKRSEVMSGFVGWANANPRYAKDAAVDTLFRYLAEAYPCRN